MPTYRLGLPFWGLQGWVGSLYPKGAKPGDFLHHYASVFPTVEGNTTFYSLPSETTVERWREATPDSFRFCFKLPKTVTHGQRLAGGEAEREVLRLFFSRLEPLGPRLGTFLVQLPPSFGPDLLARLDPFLGRMPRAFHFAVELRQTVFYQQPLAGEADAILLRHGAERCLIDTRALRDGDASHPDVTAARHKKPDLPAPPVALGPRPTVRMICHPDFEVSEPWLDHWAQQAARWIGEGRCPHLMIHLPDNVQVPQLARRFHGKLAEEVGLEEMPEFPGEAPPPEEPQLSLF